MAVSELRIHGVSGTPPENVLNNPLVSRVAGDDQTGFFRPRVPLSDDLPPQGVEREAYSWGYLTAGAAARALWLLLLPFTLANLALWMRPARPTVSSSRRAHFADRLVLGACRTICLSLTLTLVLAAAGVTMDLLAWQCAGSTCAESHWLLQRVAGWLPGLRLVVGSVGPLAVVGLLWILGRATWQRYEEHNPTSDAHQRGRADVPLTEAGFWRGRYLVGRLRAVHLAAAFGLVATLIAYPAWRSDVESGSARAHAGGSILVSATILVVAMAFVIWLRPVVARDEKALGWMWTFWIARGLSIGLVLSAMGYAAADRPGWISSGPMPGHAGAVTILFFLQMGFLAVLAFGTYVLRRYGWKPHVAESRAGELKPAFRGFAAPVVSAIALFVGAGFSAGVMFWAAGYLGEGLRLPTSFSWAAFATFPALVALGLFALMVRFRVIPHLQHRAQTITDGDYPGVRSRAPQWATRLDRVIGTSSLTDQASRLIAPIVLSGVVMGTALVLLAVSVDIAPNELGAPGGALRHVAVTLTQAGSWLISLLAIGLVLLGIRAYRTPQLRRGIGIVWDVGTFWPRSAHPLAPPCYAERAIPELLVRTEHLARCGGVVLAGHSQGSVLAAAVVLQMSPETLPRCALLTFGSPLRRLYSRYFPAYLGSETFDAVATRLSDPERRFNPRFRRWRNLWRATDPIGGPVMCTGVDKRLVDPSGFMPPPGDTVTPPIMGHFHYEADPAYELRVSELTGSFRKGASD